ncbi:hypothetical protein [Arenibaculum pallidiluteum]|uniref:hypothetical protein n=1 Tax=Arenibaculum pallidiluteum TaxID=2812559 RepID=UPI001A97CEDD|nr:hypothetical protein [Arenibaculum pallidiluteum]
MSDNAVFADLRSPRRVWALGAVHGEVERLMALHDEIGHRFVPGDRLVYLGNLIGLQGRTIETIDELLAFRRALIAMPGMLASDVVYLRGGQEEMWQKLLQIHLAPNPAEVLAWMLHHGVEPTLAAYGGGAEDGMRLARAGAVALTRWTGGLRSAMRSHPGHETLFSALRRAAFTSAPGRDGATGEDPQPAGLLLVHAGLDPARPLGAQGDAFWWGAGGFGRIEQPYETFRRVVRGYDPALGGIQVGEASATIDSGAGRGGRLACACLTPAGEILEILEA